MKNLNLLLIGEEPSERPIVEKGLGLDEVHISSYAHDKAFKYAELIIQRKGRSLEVGGFLTTPKEARDRVARDAFLARDQEVTSVSYILSPQDVKKAKQELDKMGQRIVGWWHSHGRMRTFHSDIDDKNQMVLLNQIAPSNYSVIRQEETRGLQSRLEGNSLIFWDPANPRKVYSLDIKNDNPELIAKRLRITKEEQIGFAYSFVVNHHRWLNFRVPYCEIATREVCSGCLNDNAKSKTTGYKIFDEGDFEIDEEQLIVEIDERVHLAGTRRKYFLPEDFERERAAGTLTKPEFALGTSPIYPAHASNLDLTQSPPINYAKRYWKK
ncbi:MAG: Mov34/MPN/PAD-1 family protein [Nanoarchaeota archaeon]|nr:Mov34/MPN/PAD-1 family protein [Nanoarchaeota archaeon]